MIPKPDVDGREVKSPVKGMWVFHTKTGLRIYCKSCRAIWSYPARELSPGGLLTLVDHIAGHEEAAALRRGSK